MSIYIEKDMNIELFLEEALPKCNAMATSTTCCPFCDNAIILPIIARERDIKSFELLLEIIKKYLCDKRVPEMILKEIMNNINERLNIQ